MKAVAGFLRAMRFFLRFVFVWAMGEGADGDKGLMGGRTKWKEEAAGGEAPS
jgi:hypothetical protein